MGSNRREHKESSTAKVSVREILGIETDTIYRVWVDYNKFKKAGASALTAIQLIKNVYEPIIFDYFTFMGLELLNAEIIRKGECHEHTKEKKWNPEKEK